ncbi:lipase family protein [Litoreibacter roseus]|uniref:Fungal lipase-type domain-containing protein n=1 Tax=Litoreibacter roseus TaxID=2601869 RepID=A0A6N6JK41_9RHOB|nr:lipase family protein [Litoreibacter roseus]GFE65562.1 hypothetical protein KIN_26360 [Litoreibacter roseus]
MLQPASREEVRQVGGPLWLLINQSHWSRERGQFKVTRNAASSILAHLAYCAIGEEERNNHSRAKLVPCEMFQRLVIGEEFDFADALESLDFQGVHVIRTRRSVAVLIPARTFIFVAVRGTQFAYDWLVNLNAFKSNSSFGGRIHRGFLNEAEELASAIRDCLSSKMADRISKSDCAIYLSGHSLGGAIAALLNQMQFQVPINDCYIFGSPRVGKLSSLIETSRIFATRRHLDIVAHCPPRMLGFENYARQFTCSGAEFDESDGLELQFFGSWLFGLALKNFQQHHSMEHYRFEAVGEARRDPQNSRYWREDWPDFAPL